MGQRSLSDIKTAIIKIFRGAQCACNAGKAELSQGTDRAILCRRSSQWHCQALPGTDLFQDKTQEAQKTAVKAEQRVQTNKKPEREQKLYCLRQRQSCEPGWEPRPGSDTSHPLPFPSSSPAPARASRWPCRSQGRGARCPPQPSRYSLERHGSRLQRAARRGLLVQLAEQLLGLALVLLQVPA